MERKLCKSKTDRMLFGVCGGLAKYFGIDPTIIRLISVLLACAYGSGLIAYLIAALIMPNEE